MIDLMMDLESFDWKKYVLECLNSTFFCTLATWEEKSVWSNPVYFAWDSNYCLYFISPPKSRHMSNIRINQNVSLSIYSTQQSPDGDVCGLYIEGKATIVPDDEVENAYSVYYKRRFPDTGKSDTPISAHMGESAAWKFVKIVPVHIYYFDTRFFDEVRQEVPISKLKS
jgi:uncharacterized protein YhbP (UPF0306 family)